MARNLRSDPAPRTALVYSGTLAPAHGSHSREQQQQEQHDWLALCSQHPRRRIEQLMGWRLVCEDGKASKPLAPTALAPTAAPPVAGSLLAMEQELAQMERI